MNSIDIWILAGVPVTSFVVALSGAMMPGPLLTVTVGESARRGFWAGPLIIVGHAALELALVLLLLIGLGAWLHRPWILGVVGLSGAGVLAWMGLGLVKASRHSRLEFDSQTAGGLHPVWAGVLMSLANPYWLLWWLTIGLGYVLFSAKFGLFGVFLFFIGHILADFAWYSLVSAAVAQGRHFLSDKLYRGFLAGCGVFLVAFGGYFGIQGVKFLLAALPA
ncbi:MAG: LysE family transporter [Deltaproteobacteria bacterium]|nr:LysE family transporter [Deltaproteobacteria bacterium]